MNADPRIVLMSGTCNIGTKVTVSGPGMFIFLIVGIDDGGGEE